MLCGNDRHSVDYTFKLLLVKAEGIALYDPNHNTISDNICSGFRRIYFDTSFWMAIRNYNWVGFLPEASVILC